MSRLNELVAAGRHAEVEKEAEELLAQRPADGLLWRTLAQALWMQGKDALLALQRSVELLPEDAGSHCNLGTALRAHGRPEEAARCYRRALQIRPDFAEAHSNLGSALLDLGRVDEALECYRRALAIQPLTALFHSNMGDALRTRGQPQEAASCYRRALELDPNLFEAHAGLGNALQELMQLDQALSSYRRALALNSKSARAHTDLGDFFLKIGRMSEAEACYRHALGLDPLHVEAHNGLAGALRMQSRGSEAEASCRRALEIKPNFVLASVCLAQLESEKGRFEQAEELLKQVIAIDPDSPDAWAGIPRLRKMTRADAGWLTGAQRIADRPLLPRREATLRYAIGKYFDDVGDFDRAFANYKRANELARLQGLTHDRDAVTREFDEAIRCFDASWIARNRIEANASQRPVFIVGMPRSGTTLAEQIIASHPAAFGAGEKSNWAPISARYLATARGEERSEEYIRSIGAEYLRLLEEQSADAQRVVDKTPGNFRCLGLIHAALPNARIIHMKRDPIDTALSIYFQDFHLAHSYAHDLEDLAHYYRQYERLMQHWRSIVPQEFLLEVPYEGLIEDQETWSRRMLKFIGLPWDPKCLDFHLNERTIITFSKWQARQKISKSSVGRWRSYERYLTPLLSLAP